MSTLPCFPFVWPVSAEGGVGVWESDADVVVWYAEGGMERVELRNEMLHQFVDYTPTVYAFPRCLCCNDQRVLDSHSFNTSNAPIKRYSKKTAVFMPGSHLVVVLFISYPRCTRHHHHHHHRRRYSSNVATCRLLNQSFRPVCCTETMNTRYERYM